MASRAAKRERPHEPARTVAWVAFVGDGREVGLAAVDVAVETGDELDRALAEEEAVPDDAWRPIRIRSRRRRRQMDVARFCPLWEPFVVDDDGWTMRLPSRVTDSVREDQSDGPLDCRPSDPTMTHLDSGSKAPRQHVANGRRHSMT